MSTAVLQGCTLVSRCRVCVSDTLTISSQLTDAQVCSTPVPRYFTTHSLCSAVQPECDDSKPKTSISNGLGSIWQPSSGAAVAGTCDAVAPPTQLKALGSAVQHLMVPQLGSNQEMPQLGSISWCIRSSLLTAVAHLCNHILIIHFIKHFVA